MSNDQMDSECWIEGREWNCRSWSFSLDFYSRAEGTKNLVSRENEKGTSTTEVVHLISYFSFVTFCTPFYFHSFISVITDPIFTVCIPLLTTSPSPRQIVDTEWYGFAFVPFAGMIKGWWWWLRGRVKRERKTRRNNDYYDYSEDYEGFRLQSSPLVGTEREGRETVQFPPNSHLTLSSSRSCNTFHDETCFSFYSTAAATTIFSSHSVALSHLLQRRRKKGEMTIAVQVQSKNWWTGDEKGMTGRNVRWTKGRERCKKKEWKWGSKENFDVVWYLNGFCITFNSISSRKIFPDAFKSHRSYPFLLEIPRKVIK